MSDFNTIDVISPDAFEQLFGDNTTNSRDLKRMKEPDKTPAQPDDIPIVNFDDLEKEEEKEPQPIVERPEEKKEEPEGKKEEVEQVGDDVKVDPEEYC
jgi:hypothetical protein